MDEPLEIFPGDPLPSDPTDRFLAIFGRLCLEDPADLLDHLTCLTEEDLLLVAWTLALAHHPRFFGAIDVWAPSPN